MLRSAYFLGGGPGGVVVDDDDDGDYADDDGTAERRLREGKGGGVGILVCSKNSSPLSPTVRYDARIISPPIMHMLYSSRIVIGTFHFIACPSLSITAPTQRGERRGIGIHDDLLDIEPAEIIEFRPRRWMDGPRRRGGCAGRRRDPGWEEG